MPLHRSTATAPNRLIAALAAVLGLLLVAVLLPAAPAAAATVPVTPAFGPSIDPYASYEAEDTCRYPTVQPGILAIRDLIKATYPAYVASGFVTTRSCHGSVGTDGHMEGRALDWMASAGVPAQKAVVMAFIGWLTAPDAYGHTDAMARRLGVMYMIYNHRMWRAYPHDGNPSGSWEPYTGSDPHTSHIHISLSWAGAREQTSFYAAPPLADPCVAGESGCRLDRLSGANRYATSVAVGRQAFPDATTVVLASGEDAHLVDGLVAAPLARSLSAPLLLTTAAALPSPVLTDLTARGVTTAWLVGGTAAIGPDVEAWLGDHGVTVHRLQGADRYATAAQVAAKVAGGTTAGRVVVASGADANLVDALAASGPASRLGLPIVLTRPEGLPDSVAGLLTALEPSSVVVVGGTGAVGNPVVSDLAAVLSSAAVNRAAGADRFATARAVADLFAPQVPMVSVVVASGADSNLVDALPGGVLGEATVLTRQDAFPGASATWLAAQSDVASATVLGGFAAVSPTVTAALQPLLAAHPLP